MSDRDAELDRANHLINKCHMVLAERYRIEEVLKEMDELQEEISQYTLDTLPPGTVLIA